MPDPHEEIYRKYKSLIYSYLYRSTLNSHIAEELTHDTFLKAFKGINSFKGTSSLKTWLFKIARNTYLNYIMRNDTRLEELFDLNDFQVIDHKDDYSALAEKLLIRKVLFKIPEKSRTLIILRDLYGMSYKEIASIVGDNEGQVKIGLHRARKSFKEVYQQENKEGELS